MSDWRKCIVVLIDLIGVKRQSLKGSSGGSSLMRKFHEVVCREMRAGLLTSLDHAYVWNDAVLLLAYLDERSRPPQEILDQACALLKCNRRGNLLRLLSDFNFNGKSG